MDAINTTNAVICAVLLVMAGTQAVKAQTTQELAVDLAAQSQKAMEDCGNRFPKVNWKNIVAKMECTNRAQAILLPTWGNNRDLVQAFMAYRMVVAERIQNKKMTMTEGVAALTQRLSEMRTEVQRRNAYAAQTTAQQNAAVAQQNAADRANAAAAAQIIFQALKPAPAPAPNVHIQSTCMHNGNFTFCN